MQEVYTDLEDNKTEIHKAVNVLKKTLKEDAEYYNTWQANIAMAFFDRFREQYPETYGLDIHNVSNEAAKNFLNLLIK